MERLILFDGVCNLCNGSVNFIIDRDPSEKFMFASLQSASAEKYLQSANYMDSIVYIKRDHIWYKSDAVLEIARELGGLWPVFCVFKIIPKKVRDWVYDWVASNRYRWFGKREVCRVPTKELKDRFLD
jgi:predicted DCC family thiol-disulfide oxidoreductase YuxK